MLSHLRRTLPSTRCARLPRAALFRVESLEPRQFLDGTAFGGTTLDGDRFTVSLLGPGRIDLDLTRTDDNGLSLLALADTDRTTILRISVQRGQLGDGVIALQSAQGSQGEPIDLASVDAPKVAINGRFNLWAPPAVLAFESFSGDLNLSGSLRARQTLNLGAATNLALTLSSGALTLNAKAIIGSSISAPSITLLNITGTQIADNFTGNTIDAPAGVGAVRVAGILPRSGGCTFNCDVGSITFGSIVSADPKSPYSLELRDDAGSPAGRTLGSLRTLLGPLDGALSAGSFGSISSAGSISGTITATTTNPRTRAIGSISARSAPGLSIGADPANAGIGSINLTDWTGRLSAASVGSIIARGTLAITLSLQNAGPGLTLGTVRAGTIAGASWYVSGNVGAITAGTIAPDLLGTAFSLRASGSVQTVNVTGPGGFDANLSASSFGSIRVTAAISGTVTATGADRNGYGIASLFAGRASGLALDAAAAGIGSVSIADWNQGGLSAGFLGSLTTRGGVGIAGDLSANIALTGAQGRDTLGTLSLRGTLRSAAITVAGDAGRISLARAADSSILVGLNAPVSSLPTDGGVFAPAGGTIRSLRFTAPFDASSPSLAGTILVARRIDSLTSLSPPAEASGGSIYGLAARSIGLLSGRRPDGSVFSIRETTAQDRIDGLNIQIDDFRIRII